MKMKYETTVGSVGGSSTTVIPSFISKALETEKGDKLEWEAHFTENGVIVTIKKKK